MALKRERRGSGITVREELVMQLPSEAATFEEDYKDYLEQTQDKISFAGWVKPLQEKARELLLNAGMPAEYGKYYYRVDGDWRPADSSEEKETPSGWERGGLLKLARAFGYDDSSEIDYAARTMELSYIVECMITGQNSSQAAKFAVQLGELVAEARIKFEWESDALRGRQSRESYGAAVRRSNRERREAAIARYQEWQQIADRIWRGNPSLSKSRAAESVRRKLESQDLSVVPSVNTIRKHIVKR